MSALTSLLVRDRAVSVQKIEEALQQQVLRGGDIETILLEMNLVPEDVLSAYRAALYGLLPATREEVMRASREARSQMPSEMARALGVIPILFEGRCLVVAAAEPLTEEVMREVRAKLGCELSVRIVTQMRLAAGLAHHYGFELDARSRRLADALRKRDPGVIPYVRPPSASLRPSMRPPGSSLFPFGMEPDTREQPLPPAGGPASAPGAQAADTTAAVEPEARPAAEAGASGAAIEAAQAAPAEPVPHDAEPTAAAHAAEPTDVALVSSGVANDASDPSAAAAAALARSVLAAPRIPREGMLSGFHVERSTTLPPSTVSSHIVRALRGPVSAERVRELLAQAAHRDDVLFVLLRYAAQFFDFVALFSIGKEGARGRMAHGVGLTQELMEQVVVPLSGNGLAARATRDKRPLVGDFCTGDEERAALALLGRPAGRPGLAFPVVLSGRVALLVYADREGEGLSADDAAPLAEVAGLVSDALRRIIVAQKALRGVTSRPPHGGSSSSTNSGGEAPPGASSPVEPSSAAPDGASGAAQAVEADAQAAADIPQVVDAGGQAASDSPPVAEATAPVAEAGELAPEGAEQAAREAAPEPVAPTAGDETYLAEVEQTPVGDGLTAIDLQAVSRLTHAERKRSVTEAYSAVRTSSLPPEMREAVRGRVPGVPRSAPPPPLRDSAPQVHGAGAYSYVSPTGAVLEETVRPFRHVSTQPLALDMREALAESAPLPVVEAPPEPEPTPPPEAREKSPARAPARLSLVTPEQPEPSVIIDLGEQVNALVDAVMRSAPDGAGEAIAELLKVGEGVLPVLLQHFPGPLWFDESQSGRRRPRGRDVSGLARCIVAFGPRAASYLASKLSTSEPDVCRYALMVAEEIIHPDLLEAVARRAFDVNDAVRALALEVLRAYAVLPQFDSVLRTLCDLSARPGRDPRRQRLAVEALSELRDARAFRTLVARLSDPTEAIVDAARRALVLLTGQDFGFAPRKWELWGEQVQGQHRVEWLIDALGQAEEPLRALASEELKQLTQQYFGYHPALPKRDRELAQRKYRDWWEREGRALFKR